MSKPIAWISDAWWRALQRGKLAGMSTLEFQGARPLWSEERSTARAAQQEPDTEELEEEIVRAAYDCADARHQGFDARSKARNKLHAALHAALTRSTGDTR